MLFPKKYWHSLKTAAKIAEERETQYGDIEENFSKIQKILEVAFGEELTEAQIAKVFIATKLARQCHQPKDDNIFDSINYLAILNFFQK